MTIYIAARYNEKERNEKIALALRKQGFSSILPRKFRMRADTREKSKYIYNECLKSLNRTSTLLVISPFGRDVAFEIGYFQHLRESLSTDPTRTMHIVRFNTDTTRAIQDDMISNSIDYESDDFKEICNYLSRYEAKTFPIPKKKRNYKKKFRSDAELRVS